MIRILPLALLALAACSRTPETTGSGPAKSTTPASTGAATTSAAASTKLHWTDPPAWTKRTPSSAMRAAEYLVPRAGGDATDAECVVITFGAGEGGDVGTNVDRWIKQFDPATAKLERKQASDVAGMHVTTVEITGTYKPMAMPGAPGDTSPKPGSRMLGAIVEAPSGAWFFKLTGPDATVKQAVPAFEAMIASAKP